MEVHVFEETDSTNNVLKKMTGEPAEYIAAVTSKQTAGRGRKGHSFAFSQRRPVPLPSLPSKRRKR